MVAGVGKRDHAERPAVQPPPTLAGLASIARMIDGITHHTYPAPKAVGCNRLLDALFHLLRPQKTAMIPMNPIAV